MTKEASKAKKILGIIGNVFIWIFVAFSVIVTITVLTMQKDDGVPSLFGKSFLSIKSGSMEPIYEIGDLVYTTKISDEEKGKLKEGDIITFKSPIDIENSPVKAGDLITHKVVENNTGAKEVKTQGENSAIQDSFTVSYSDIIGVCTPDGKVKGLGGVISWIGSQEGFLICVVLPMFLFFVYELYNFITIIVARKQSKVAAELSDEEKEEIERAAVEKYLAEKAAKEAEEAAAETPDGE